MSYRRLRRAGPLAAVLGAMLIAASMAGAQTSRIDQDEPDYSGIIREQSSPEVGRDYYNRYCAICHGKTGDGAGPMAELLKDKPTDLRTLGQRYGTPLPAGRLAEFIDGSEIPPAHGIREMPVWGEAFDTLPWTGGSERENTIRNRVARIIDFLDTIQIPAAGNRRHRQGWGL